jgi:hypothetical protein
MLRRRGGDLLVHKVFHKQRRARRAIAAIPS